MMLMLIMAVCIASISIIAAISWLLHLISQVFSPKAALFFHSLAVFCVYIYSHVMVYHVISQDMYAPLHYAVKEGHLAVIETLIKSGARVNSVGKVIVMISFVC